MLVMKMVFKVVRDFLVLLLVPAPFQEITLATDPRESLCTAMRATGNHRIWDSCCVMLFKVVIHLINLFSSIPDVTRTLLTALEETMITLNLGNLFF